MYDCRVAFTPSMRPKRAKAAVTVNHVRTASVGLRQSALHISGAYFTAFSLLREYGKFSCETPEKQIARNCKSSTLTSCKGEL